MWWSLKEYYRPQTVSQMLRLLARFEPSAALLAGGTRLVAEHDPGIEVLLDLSALNLDYIEARPRQMRLGALTSLQTLVSHPAVKGLAGGILSQAAECGAPRPIRNRATVGGTLATSESTSELALALLVLDAQVVLRAPDRRVLGLADFHARRKEHLSAPALIVEALVPTPPAGSAAALAGVRPTRRDRPIVSAAALVSRKGDILQSVRLALCGVAPVPIRLFELESVLVGGRLEEVTLERVSQEVAGTVNPPSDERASAKYRRAMAGVTVARALRQAWEQAGKG